MLNRDDWMELELNKQLQRLKYIETVLSGNAYCNYPPRRIIIEPTNYCNVSCVHCVHDGTMTRKKGYMDLGVFRKILEDVKDWNRTTEICLFQHGEPLLHKDITKMTRLAGIEYDFFTKMNTNGVALTKELSEKLIRSGLDYIVFSLDAITPKTYAKIKRRDYFKRVINNILDYMEIWGDLDTGEVRNYFACDINILEEDANRNEIPLFTELFEKLPVGHVSTYELHNFTGAVEESMLNSKSQKSCNDHSPCCNTPWDLLAIQWNGDAVACIYDFDARYVIGNVKEQSIWEIWNSNEMMRFRKTLYERKLGKIEKNGPMCSTCSIRWMKDYQLPTDYYKEIGRMQQYLDGAIDRVARRWLRTEALLEKHKFLKQNREAWLNELLERGKELI
jgi:radical SAM protein with 4Fe4S-binding SPASM domain